MIILKIKDLYKNFGGLVATNNISFYVNKGEKLGILGPNGAGKTTLFNLISGFIKPDKGEIIFREEDITNKKPEIIVEKGLVRTFQIPKPFKGLTILENIKIATLSPKQKKLFRSNNERNEYIDYILDLCDLYEYKNVLTNNLSQGNLKKLEVAKALATKPQLMLLDEPFAGLTHEEIAPIAKLIQILNEKEEVTIILIEHRLKEFMKLVDRVIAIDYGEKIAEGNPAEIVRNKLVIEAYLGKGGEKIVNS